MASVENLTDQLDQIILSWKIKKKQKVFVGCSGGPDSVALLWLLQSLRKKKPFQLGVLHFNHKLRGKKSDQDEAFVRKLCRSLGISCITGKGDVRKRMKSGRFSMEEAARKERYDFFLRAAKKYCPHVIALAHTQDDQAETILMRLIQGTGVRGLCGIREELKMNGVAFARPLLQVNKKEILFFLRSRKIDFRKDETNNSPKFLRNRIRRELIPMLQKYYNPSVVQALARIPRILRDENEIIEKLGDQAWAKIARRRKTSVVIMRKAFLDQPQAIQFRLLDRALKYLNPESGLSFEAWGRLTKSFVKKTDSQTLPRDIQLILTSSSMTLRVMRPSK